MVKKDCLVSSNTVGIQTCGKKVYLVSLTRESVVLATKSAKSVSDAAITMIMLYHTETVSSYFVTYLLCVCVWGGGGYCYRRLLGKWRRVGDIA